MLSLRRAIDASNKGGFDTKLNEEINKNMNLGEGNTARVHKKDRSLNNINYKSRSQAFI